MALILSDLMTLPQPPIVNSDLVLLAGYRWLTLYFEIWIMCLAF